MSAPDILCVPFKNSDIIFVGDAKKYKHLRTGIRREELGDLPLIYSDIWENYLSEISGNILPDRRIFKMHCNMLSDAKEFCSRGIGCCFFPEIIVRKEIEDGRLMRIPIVDLEVKHFQIYIVYNKQRLASKAITCWLNSYTKIFVRQIYFRIIILLNVRDRQIKSLSADLPIILKNFESGGF